LSLTRRAFLELTAAASTAAIVGCRTAATPEEQLAAALGLTADEQSWIAELTPEDRQHLLAALSSGAAGKDPRALNILFGLLRRRDRLFAFVGYPPVAARRSVCDGLLRE
jgi:hypothetical protein